MRLAQAVLWSRYNKPPISPTGFTITTGKTRRETPVNCIPIWPRTRSNTRMWFGVTGPAILVAPGSRGSGASGEARPVESESSPALAFAAIAGSENTMAPFEHFLAGLRQMGGGYAADRAELRGEGAGNHVFELRMFCRLPRLRLNINHWDGVPVVYGRREVLRVVEHVSPLFRWYTSRRWSVTSWRLAKALDFSPQDIEYAWQASGI